MTTKANKELIPDVLADRYATSEMVAIWGPRQKNILERRLWLAVLRSQNELGLEVPAGAIEAYDKVLEDVDLASISRREADCRHDIKAKIDEFNELAGYQCIHRGMTSRDLTDNIEQMQIRKSMLLVRDKAVAVLKGFANAAGLHIGLAIVGRTHNVAAQITTDGKRFANAGEEMLMAYNQLEYLIENYPLRGIKGPIGTSQDQIDLLGSASLARQLEEGVASELGFDMLMNSVGQVYPRSLDYDVATRLALLAAGPSSMATTIRLMAGYDLMTEGFKKHQKGSSAMPHKMNARTSERVCGFNDIIQGYADMISRLSGRQWQEGDVSCSVVRRAVFPSIFFAIDGQFESLLTIFGEMGVYEAMVRRELNHYLPFLATTGILMAAVKKGMGRESAYAIIQEHTTEVAKGLHDGTIKENCLFERLGEDDRMPFSEAEIRQLANDPIDLTGDAVGQVRNFVNKVAVIVGEHPEAASYQPNGIL